MLTVAIDLDETLLCVTRKALNRTPTAECKHGHIYLRPHAITLLDSLSSTSSVGIWTSAPQPYVNDVLRASGLAGINLKFVWAARECSFVDYGTGAVYAQKDTNKLRVAFETDAVLLVDNSPEKIVGHGNDGIVAKSYHGEEDDDELPIIFRFIERIQKSPECLNFGKFKWRHLV